MPIPDGVPDNFALKQVAHLEFLQGASSRSKRGNMKGEQAYREYFDDLVANREAWLLFFDHPQNYEHAEHTCGILGTLATVLRQRGTQDVCQEVLEMEHEVLLRYERACIGSGDPQQVHCFDELKYKFQVIQYNLYFQTQRYDECIPLYRELATHELKYDMDFDKSNFLWMIAAFANKQPSASTLRKLKDREVMRIVKAPLDHAAQTGQPLELSNSSAALATCATCATAESAIGTFKKCACKEAVYCGKECQVCLVLYSCKCVEI